MVKILTPEDYLRQEAAKVAEPAASGGSASRQRLDASAAPGGGGSPEGPRPHGEHPGEAPVGNAWTRRSPCGSLSSPRRPNLFRRRAARAPMKLTGCAVSSPIARCAALRKTRVSRACSFSAANS